ncbi:DMT family transporter [Haloarcula sp. Atlit-120R]|uniref:DMT family transporter n=1 Tax=Haloarcula sp. Atlit-120R TaxID=2282135 RepID=UPI000EF17BBF|nr:DMT family transporter [Haloarcula sp. Atlit-120R]RLM37228.1 DMT family transporter [Haloarcula sp. Atlit-120R]
MRFRNAILFVALAVAWGSAFTAIKAGLEYFPPILFAAFRYDLAGVLMLGYAVYATDQWFPKGRSDWIVIGIGGTLMIAAYHIFLFVGEQGTTSAAAAIVVSLSPILTTGFARAFLPDERLTTLGIVGLLVGFVGVGVLSNPDPGNLLNPRTVSLVLVFLAATAFALGSVLTRRVDDDLEIETMEAWSMLLGAVLMHGVSLGAAESIADVQWTGEAVLALLYLVVVASALGFLIYFDLLERLGPIEINLVSYAAPVVAAATGLLFLGETPTVYTGVGFGCILIGFGLLKRDALRNEVARFGGTPRRGD